MAKKALRKSSDKVSKSAINPNGKLAGKTVAFIGKFGYLDLQRRRYGDIVAAEGGKVVDYRKKNPDYLWVGEGRGGKPPSDVAKVQKSHPAVNVLETKDFVQLLMPDANTILRLLKARKKGDDPLWDSYCHIADFTGSKIAVPSADLRKLDLQSADLTFLNLDGGDLREANLKHVSFGKLDGVNLSGVQAKNVFLDALHNCQFQNADLANAWFFYGNGKVVEGCDFSGADISSDAQLDDGKFVDCKFVKAKLCDGEAVGGKFEGCDFTEADLTRLRGTKARFANCTFMKANLQRANLTNASLAGANLRGANLREAVLIDADLRNADLTGADLQNAALGGAKLDGVDLSKAKNYTPPVQRKAGPKLKEFNAAAAGSKSFTTTAEIDLGKDEFAKLSADVRKTNVYAGSYYQSPDSDAYDDVNANNLQQAILDLRARWPTGKLRLDSITAKGSQKLRGKALQQLAIAAWAEAFDIKEGTAEQLAQQKAGAAQERDELLKKVRKEGAKAWNKLESRVRDRLDLTGADLSNAKLNKLEMWGREDLAGANFSGSSLAGAQLWGAKLHNANFTGADLKKVEMARAQLQGANLAQADLTGAQLASAKLQGANFTGATLKGAALDGAQFDHKTVFPSGFKPSEKMVWKGEGTRPAAKKPPPAKAVGSLDFADFIKALNRKVELARMEKASSMLKKEKFQLFAEVDGEALGGIVKSQTDKDLVYSCRLTSKGDFGCCTQNLNACGGLRGALCKHLLVLIIGLAKAGQLDSATVDNWINLSRSQKPKIDSDAMSATFLKYKGAEAGEIDWRPTETIPEDFYSM
jgi:uncharacterized protein YjbI with pentapeptide repeats